MIEIPDLWGDDIKVDVLSPLVILKAQDEKIRGKTQGILTTEVFTVPTSGPGGDALSHELTLVAPALGYREALVRVQHKVGRPYPVWIEYEDEVQDEEAELSAVCNSADEFFAALRTALQSKKTRSAIASLIALSNEARLGKAVAG